MNAKKYGPDWTAIRSRTITIGELMNLAAGLCTDPGDPPNVEYERAMAELVTDAAGLPMEWKVGMALRIGLKADITRSIAFESMALGKGLPLRKGQKGSKPRKGASARIGEIGLRILEV